MLYTAICSLQSDCKALEVWLWLSYIPENRIALWSEMTASHYLRILHQNIILLALY